MRVYLAEQFGAGNSKPVFAAFRQGLIETGDEVTESFEQADVIVIWSLLFRGRMQGNQTLWDAAKHDKKPVVVLEVGALKRNQSWRVGINGINRKATWVEPFEQDRHKKFGIELSPWRKEGRYITICTQRPDSSQWEGMPSVDIWVNEMIQKVRQHTDTPIIVRPHPRDQITDFRKIKQVGTVYFDQPQHNPNTYDSYNIDTVLNESLFLINHSSGPCIEAAISGTHVICSQDSLAFDISETFENITSPQEKDRTEWLSRLAHTEWFVEEIAKGTPWQHLKQLL